LSEIVKIGCRVELIEMNDSFSKLKKGSRGTIVKIDKDQELIWVDWDTGEKLALIEDIDKFKILPQIKKEK
jgi:hypothetical protein